MPDNTTNLSFAGLLKWMLIIASLPSLIKAYQGIVLGKTATRGGFRSVGDLVLGREAQVEGLKSLGAAVVFLALSWALWFFWQRNED